MSHDPFFQNVAPCFYTDIPYLVFQDTMYSPGHSLPRVSRYHVLPRTFLTSCFKIPCTPPDIPYLVFQDTMYSPGHSLSRVSRYHVLPRTFLTSCFKIPCTPPVHSLPRVSRYNVLPRIHPPINQESVVELVVKLIILSISHNYMSNS
jgi:hypothetical protein